ncbi:MAG TPA: EF-P beta-lysylation protein EpmB [Methylothermaceae bacterium]|nr:EF-P beta-lysylation protein EpmB [Methylothermaceae bacterium]
MAAIIPHPSRQPDWQRELAEGFKHPEELLQFLDLPLSLWDRRATASFAFRVPKAFAVRMRPGDPDDPLLLQVLPRIQENLDTPGFVADPVGDRAAEVTPGLLHKYQGRVLMIATGACAVHCRYCFRRLFPYQEQQLTASRWQAALGYIQQDASIKEVILSGGDPLVLSDTRLHRMIAELAAVPHLQRLRIHSRLPIVLPSRVNDDLLTVLTGTRLTPVMVVHINHGNEIDAAVRSAVARLRGHGITVLNQSTLLAGINDKVETLVTLQESLFAAGILPYYLHLLDRTSGTAHFEVAPARALLLHEQLRRRLPGYLVPRLARDLPEAPYKIAL